MSHAPLEPRTTYVCGDMRRNHSIKSADPLVLSLRRTPLPDERQQKLTRASEARKEAPPSHKRTIVHPSCSTAERVLRCLLPACLWVDS